MRQVQQVTDRHGGADTVIITADVDRASVAVVPQNPAPEISVSAGWRLWARWHMPRTSHDPAHGLPIRAILLGEEIPASGDRSMAETTPKPGQRALSVTVTLAAFALGVLHHAHPDVELDAMTVFLFLIAIAPWVSPIIKNIELPGGWKVEFRDLRREIRAELKQEAAKVEKLEARVREVEEFAISGAIAGDAQAQLNDALVSFDQYLRNLGFELTGSPPTVHISEERYENAHYDYGARQIVLGQDFVDDHDVMFREYTHHALTAELPTGILEQPSQGIESGLADYFPCSHQNSPVVGAKVAVRLREVFDLDTPYIRNLRNRLNVAELTSPDVPSQRVGAAWGGLFWDLRQSLGHQLADRVLAAAWRSTYRKQDAQGRANDFVKAMVDRVDQQAGADARSTVRRLLKERGVPG